MIEDDTNKKWWTSCGGSKKPRKKNDMKEYAKDMDRWMKAKPLYFAKKYEEKNRIFYNHYHAEPSYNRSCVVKMKYGTALYYGSSAKAKIKNIQFLREYLTQLHKSAVEEKPLPFASEEMNREKLEAYMKEYEAHASDTFFKFIVSPENCELDIRVLVRQLVAKMEAVQGRKFRWIASVHTDTAHPHAHILINGSDMKGEKLPRFEKDFIKNDLRAEACRITTDLAGRKTKEEVEMQKSEIYKRCRYTVFDTDIEKIETRYDIDDPKCENGKWDGFADADSTIMLQRLLMLVQFGFAAQDRKNRKRFHLERHWATKLRAAGRYNSFLRARAEADPASAFRLSLYTSDCGPVSGKVTRIYHMNEEESWNNALVIEDDKRGMSWYVPLFKNPDDSLLDTDVSVSVWKNQHGLLVPSIKKITRYSRR